ncbi:MAG: hypothetical protein AAFV33_20625 [Chloroflexota bacterium]
MAEFVAFHPENETLGAGILPLLSVLKPRGIHNILRAEGLDSIQPDQWYPQQAELNVLKAASLTTDFVNIGVRIPDIVAYETETSTLEDALMLLNAGYQHNHRGPDVGCYHYEWTGKRAIQIVCYNPYPSDMDYGIIYRLVQKYRPADSGVFAVLRQAETPDRTLGGESCTFNATW